MKFSANIKSDFDGCFATSPTNALKLCLCLLMCTGSDKLRIYNELIKGKKYQELVEGTPHTNSLKKQELHRDHVPAFKRENIEIEGAKAGGAGGRTAFPRFAGVKQA